MNLATKIKNYKSEITGEKIFFMVIYLVLFGLLLFNVFTFTMHAGDNVGNTQYMAEHILKIASLTGIIVAVLFTRKNIKKLERVFLVTALIIGCSYMFVMTPLAIPDEDFHYHSSYIVSNYIMCKDDKLAATENHMDWSEVSLHYNVPSAYNRFSDSMILSKNEISNTIKIKDRYGLNYPVEFLPQAIGVTIGRLCHFSFCGVFYLGRLFNLLFYVFCAYLAIKKIPQFKEVMFSVALLPMAMHQAASFSYDSFINGMSFLLIALIVNKIISEEKFSRKDFIEILIVAVLLAPAKVIYFALIGLIFLVPKERYDRGKKEKMVTTTIIIVIGMLCIIAFMLPSLLGLIGQKTASNFLSGQETYTLAYVLDNPIRTIKIFAKTIVYRGSTYFLQGIGLALAGLSLRLPLIIIVAFIAQLFLCSLITNKFEYVFNGKQKVWMAFLSVCISGMVLATLMLDWTPLDSKLIEGVQGRYFLPVLPLLLFILRNKLLVLTRDLNAYLITLVIILHYPTINCIVNYTFSQ